MSDYTDLNPTADDTSPLGAEPPAGSGPVAADERFTAIDVVRGFALLGILAMNIPFYGLAIGSKGPSMADSMTGASYWTWLIGYLLLDSKMRSLFAMLFGAGLVLMSERAESRGRSPARLFYRRSTILLGIGLLHGYLLWTGDILFHYALSGMVVYLFRQRSPATLIALGMLTLAIGLASTGALAGYLRAGEAASRRVEVAGGSSPTSTATPDDRLLAEGAAEFRKGFEPTAAEVEKKRQTFGEGSFRTVFRARARETFFVEFFLFPIFLAWDTSSRMLIGMALMKLGYVTGARSRSSYAWLTALGYGIGLPVVGAAIYGMVAANFGSIASLEGMAVNEAASILVALGHLGALMLVIKAGAMTWLTSRLAAVGRMALTNYLSHSIICTTLFYGYGFGLYGRLSRAELMLVVVSIWAFQLWISPIWLRRFRFGPFEWVWRSLTYGRAQPFRAGRPGGDRASQDAGRPALVE